MARTGEYEAFFNLISQVLQVLSNRDFIQFNEKQIKMGIIANLMLSNIFEAKSGYPDRFLFKKSSNPYQHHRTQILEKRRKRQTPRNTRKNQRTILYR